MSALSPKCQEGPHGDLMVIGGPQGDGRTSRCQEDPMVSALSPCCQEDLMVTEGSPWCPHGSARTSR